MPSLDQALLFQEYRQILNFIHNCITPLSIKCKGRGMEEIRNLSKKTFNFAWSVLQNIIHLPQILTLTI